MSIFQKCPHSDEECIHEIYAGEPRYNLCNTCSVLKSNSSNGDKQVGKKNSEKENNNKRHVNFGIYCRLNNCKKYKDYGYMTAWTTTEEEAIRYCKALSDKDKENKYYYFYVDLSNPDFNIINPTGDKNGRLK